MCVLDKGIDVSSGPEDTVNRITAVWRQLRRCDRGQYQIPWPIFCPVVHTKDKKHRGNRGYCSLFSITTTQNTHNYSSYNRREREISEFPQAIVTHTVTLIGPGLALFALRAEHLALSIRPSAIIKCDIWCYWRWTNILMSRVCSHDKKIFIISAGCSNWSRSEVQLWPQWGEDNWRDWSGVKVWNTRCPTVQGLLNLWSSISLNTLYILFSMFWSFSELHDMGTFCREVWLKMEEFLMFWFECASSQKLFHRDTKTEK